MKKEKVMVLRVAYVLTIVGVFGLFMSGRNLKRLNQKVDQELKVEIEKVAIQQEKLNELQKEMEEINSKDYIEKVATEQLGMIEEDTIVFRQKK